MTKNLSQFREENQLREEEELYIAIGEGRYSARQVANKVIPYTIRRRLQKKKKESSAVTREEERIVVQGASGLAVKLARCCTPVPGDQIVAFVTKGKGITIHRVDCPNLTRLSQDGERFLEAEWEEREGDKYNAGVVIEALDRPKLLADVSNAISSFQVGIKSVRASTVGNEARIYLILEVKNRQELDDVFREVKKIANVRSVRRGGAFALR